MGSKVKVNDVERPPSRVWLTLWLAAVVAVRSMFRFVALQRPNHCTPY